MPVGSWAELPSEGINSVVARPGSSGSMIPYCNSMPWDPVSKKIHVVGSDHHNYDNLPAYYNTYDDATNKWVIVTRTTLGSHGFQHLAVNPSTGDLYLLSVPTSGIYKWSNGSFDLIATVPENMSQLVAMAVCWWSGSFAGGSPQGVLTVCCGNAGTIHTWNPLTRAWRTLPEMLPGQRGEYHNVSAYSVKKNCMVYGGGNNYQGLLRKSIYRLNADQSKARMPDPPFNVGINHGMNLVSDHVSGNFLAFGFGQLWELNAEGNGAWTQMTGSRAPPAAILDPTVGGNALVSVDCSSYGVVLYVDARYNRSPNCRMWVYKHA